MQNAGASWHVPRGWRRVALRGAGALLAGVSCASQAAPSASIRILGADVYPESVAAAADGTLYTGSLGGTLYRALPGRSSAEPWISRTPQNGLLSIFGVLVDDARGLLWVCTSPAKLPGGVPTGRAAVLRFELRTGTRTASVALPAPESICDDITLARDGSAYVADIGTGAIWRLPPGGAALIPFARDPALAGIDGLAFSQSGVLYADSITHNQLLRVQVGADGSFAGLTRIATSIPLAGPDGLRLIEGERFALAEGRGGRIDEVTIRGSAAIIRVLASGLQAPAGVAFARGTVYAADGKIGYLFDPRLRGQDPGIFEIHAISLPPAR
ncbi:MAG TPA: hypothetical protein VME21_04330 [Steroidobacteraceae bacterium]|nr:hypothetical protein [Steroidobacteraceae bacterium]